jgi:U3 small nucleolar RNA-associated protein 3
LSTLEDLDFDMSDSQSGEDGGLGDDFDESDEDLELDDEDVEELFDLFNHTKGGKKKKPRLELNELQDLLKDAESDISDLTSMANGTASPKRKRKNAEKEPFPFSQEADLEPPKKKQKPSKKDKDSAKPRIPVFDLVEPEFEYSTIISTPSSSILDAADSFGEQTVLQSFDAADKKARKKSLRFHTSKIEGAATRRDKGVKNLLGGDDDIPYKERRKQKEIREAKQIARNGRGSGGDDLSDGDPEVEMDVDLHEFGDSRGKNNRGKSGENDEAVDPGQYYSLVDKSAKEKKEKKKAEYDTAKAAERYVFTTSCPPHALLTNLILVRF